MTLSRRLRHWVSAGMIAVVLFTQLAIAAYVCPGPLAQEADTAAIAAMDTEMPDCHGMSSNGDPAQPQLCKAHCTNEAQSTARGILPDLQPNPASVTLLVRVLAPIPLPSFTYEPQREPPRARAHESLPLYLSLHVLRN